MPKVQEMTLPPVRSQDISSDKAKREILVKDSLSRRGLSSASREKINADASFRRYERIRQGIGSFILMDAPPPHEDVRPFIKIDSYLVEQGFSAPKILAEDAEHGFLLLEDLGDYRFNLVLSGKTDLVNPPSEPMLYSLAVEVLAHLHECPVPDDLPEYDEALLIEHVERLTDWYLPHIVGPHSAGAQNISDICQEYVAIWKAILAERHVAEPVVALWDYHSDNLMWLPERKGMAQVGLLDFQDAMKTPRTYDLVSLLEDARRDISPEIAPEMLEYYFSLSAKVNRAEFLKSYAIMGAQRNCRILGTFARLAVRDNKHSYLQFLPRQWLHLEHDLKHPILKPLKDWLDRHVPVDIRNRVPVLAG